MRESMSGSYFRKMYTLMDCWLGCSQVQAYVHGYVTIQRLQRLQAII